MKVFFVIVLTIFSISTHASEDLSSFVARLDSTLKYLNSSKGEGCDAIKLTEASKVNIGLGEERVSVMSEEDAQKLFAELKSHGEIPFDFSIAGCEERAHEMSRLMLLKGITPMKVFASVDEDDSPRLRRPNPTKTGTVVEWKFHVAPAVLVKKGDQIVPYVLDPSLEDKAVPATEWRSAMTRHNPKMKVDMKFTPAAQFDSRGFIITNFKDNELNKSIKETLKEHKVRSKSVEGEDEYWFELQRNTERMMLIDGGW